MRYQSSILLFVMAMTFAIPAYAYLDPGSGSIILQGLLAAIAGALAAIKLYWLKLKNFFLRLLGKKPKQGQKKEPKPDDKP